MCNKRVFFVTAILFCSVCTLVSAQKYQISDVTYYSTGITKSNALQRAVSIDRTHVFETKEEFDAYVADITQQLENLRILESILAQPVLLTEQDGIIPVSLSFTVADSKHILALPKPSYDSNTGVEIKIKLKDSNFLGLLNTLNVDVNAAYSHSQEKDPYRFSLGINFDYDYPFKIASTNDTWSNDFTFNWTFGETIPEFSYETGLTISVPFGIHFFNFNISQSIVRNDDYTSYGDDTYAVEKASFALPLTIGYIHKTTKVVYTPSINFVYNWDIDGIDPTNEDLASPFMNIAHSLSTERINWIGNFRKGYSLTGSQSFGWNFQTESFVPEVTLDVKLYKAFKYAGINTHAKAFFMLNSSDKIGSELRGVRDNQYFADGSYYALKVPAALIFSLDMPVHIVTTHWLDWGYHLFGAYNDMNAVSRFFFWIPHKIFSYADFELQCSPFIDAALTRNKNHNTTFSIKDGFYDAGVEVLLYPAKWKSYVVRFSLGVDVGTKFLSKYIDTSWRDSSISPYEFMFGLGLHY